ncbi:hypothetical protein MHBO_001283 [Bonamia ostreae]|uniref:Uncharacterized protein n=1 Tax=Bonamia ostreae TaxID=126728 RepID=A0ABV2AIH1_9EUKA
MSKFLNIVETNDHQMLLELIKSFVSNYLDDFNIPIIARTETNSKIDNFKKRLLDKNRNNILSTKNIIFHVQFFKVLETIFFNLSNFNSKNRRFLTQRGIYYELKKFFSSQNELNEILNGFYFRK